MRGPDGVPVVRRDLRLEVELVPDDRVAGADRLGRLDRVVERVLRVPASRRGRPARTRRSRRGSRGRRRAGRRTGTGGSRSSRHPRGRPGSCRRRGGTGCWPASSRPRRRRRDGGRPAATPSRRAGGRDTGPVRAGSASAGAGTGSSTRGTRSSGWPCRRSGEAARPTAWTAGSPAVSRWRRTSNSRLGDAERLLLERVGPPVGDEEADQVARRPDRQVLELQRPPPTSRLQRQLPGQVEQRPGAVAEPQPREGRDSGRSSRGPSELLAQVRGDGGVVAELTRTGGAPRADGGPR